MLCSCPQQQYAFIYDCVRYILEHKHELTTNKDPTKISDSVLLDMKHKADSVKEPLLAKGSQDDLHTKL